MDHGVGIGGAVARRHQSLAPLGQEILRGPGAVRLAELEFTLADGENGALGRQMPAAVMACHLAAQQLPVAACCLGGVVHGDLDAVATIEHLATIAQ